MRTKPGLTKSCALPPVRRHHARAIGKPTVLRSDCLGDSSRALVPTMLLQPLVENAIVHGTSQQRRHLDIDIAARREGEALIIAVNDDGLGLAHRPKVSCTRAAG